MSQQHERLSPTPLPQSAVRVVTAYQPRVHKNWYDDAFDHAVGADVIVDADFGSDGSLQIELSSKGGRQTSGITLEIELARDADDTPSARVRGIAHSDRMRGNVEFTEDIRGEIFVNAISYAETHTLYIKFCLAAWWNGSPVMLMGGIHIDH
jgi:hypothetical protein